MERGGGIFFYRKMCELKWSEEVQRFGWLFAFFQFQCFISNNGNIMFHTKKRKNNRHTLNVTLYNSFYLSGSWFQFKRIQRVWINRTASYKTNPKSCVYQPDFFFAGRQSNAGTFTTNSFFFSSLSNEYTRWTIIAFVLY